MITDSFDTFSKAKINPVYKEGRFECDACIITFSHIIEKYVINKYNAELIGISKMVSGDCKIYSIQYNGKTFAFYKTLVGAPASIGMLEDATEIINTKKIVVFGGSGCLDKDIAHGKIMVPTDAYRDEGTSYHYAKASDYIEIKNFRIVDAFMKKEKLPHVLGKTWTTDAFYRETGNNIRKRKMDGCISVEMECSAFQAMCNFRELQLYYFLTSGDLLDAPEWDKRHEDEEYDGTQHDVRHFDIAIKLAEFVAKERKNNEK